MEPEFNSLIPVIPRPNEHERLVAFLLDQRFFLPVAISTSLPGARGFGKTALARAICQDPRVQQAFAEGIYWVTLGQGLSPLELIGRVEQLIFDLTGERSVLADVAAAEAQLHEMLHPRKTLLVIDEADNEEALRPFLHSGPGGACLLITHDESRLPLGSRRIAVDIMMPQEAVALLSNGLPVMDAPADDSVVIEFPEEAPLATTYENAQENPPVYDDLAPFEEEVASPSDASPSDAPPSDPSPIDLPSGVEAEIEERSSLEEFQAISDAAQAEAFLETNPESETGEESGRPRRTCPRQTKPRGPRTRRLRCRWTGPPWSTLPHWRK